MAILGSPVMTVDCSACTLFGKMLGAILGDSGNISLSQRKQMILVLLAMLKTSAHNSSTQRNKDRDPGGPQACQRQDL